ncbi:PIN domain-containing protein [Natribacillus halophilus]|uniref:PIN domain-containing protein n=1 Tax=Natribacillus halophilus TaxID=549003 RepID=A0A1G8S7B8_9BACI|nr:PIN domain-containing protein [Natribacillus halophilus]
MGKGNNSFRVFVDTNVLISAMHSRESITRKLLLILSENHHLIICSHTLTEVSKVKSK